MNTTSDPIISKCAPDVQCTYCGRIGHSKKTCSAISKVTEADTIFFSQVVNLFVIPGVAQKNLEEIAETAPEEVVEDQVWVQILTTLSQSL